MSAPVTVDLFAAAQNLLVVGWGAAFMAIVGAGTVLPALAKRAWPARSRQVRQAGALLATCLCISATLLVPDTFAVERRADTAFTSVDCVPSEAGMLQCSDGVARSIPSGSPESPGTWHALSFSGLLVHYEPRN